MSSALGRGAGVLWGWLGEARGHLYDRGVFKQSRLSVPVVSVGNLTVGGTGKTPITRALAEFFRGEGKKVAIISRNYKAQVKGPARVDAAFAHGAAYFGDEPFLLAKSLPEIPVFVGPRKSETAAFALREDPALNLLLVDDGFQHRALARDLDIVLLDATDAGTFDPLPAGRARENPAALERADWLLLTKVNWADPAAVENMRSRLPKGKATTEVRFQTKWPSLSEADVIGVFAGLARPEVFLDLARKKYFQKVRAVGTFHDHQVYGDKELAQLRDFLRRNPGAVLVTTEKDAVKIEDPEIRERLFAAELELEWRNAEAFFERLRTLDR